MNYWLVKSEPSVWSWDQQVAKGAKGEAWTGVRNFTARQNLVNMKKGDRAFFYHSNEGKEIVGIAEVIKEAYPDPTDKTGKFVCVDIKADKPLKTPVTMAAVKAETEARRHGTGEIFAPVGAAGDGGGVEARLQDGRALIEAAVARMERKRNPGKSSCGTIPDFA
ncbi:putative RNA-binding protein with PUA-like domain [Bradyrhizobium sp. LM2.7]